MSFNYYRDGMPGGDGGTIWGVAKVDFTAIPEKLNISFEQNDTDNALRTTVIKTSDSRRRKRQETLLSKLQESDFTVDQQKVEKNKAFDLLDALSRSGSLPIACGELHVIVGVSHCFEDSVMDTVIQQNVNPIEKMDESTLLVAGTIHNVDRSALVGRTVAQEIRDGSDRALSASTAGNP